MVQVCLAALPTNGAHELDNPDAQEQQAVAQHGGKSSLLHGNRVFNRAIRGPQVNAAVPRLNPQLKSQAVTIFLNTCTINSLKTYFSL